MKSSWKQGPKSYQVETTQWRLLWTERDGSESPTVISQPYAHFLSDGAPPGFQPPPHLLEELSLMATQEASSVVSHKVADFPARWPAGIFSITEDLPGRRLVLSWRGQKPWLKNHLSELVFDGEKQIFSYRTEGALFSSAHQNVIPYQSIVALWFSISKTRTAQGDLFLLLCVSYQFDDEMKQVELPIAVKGLDLLAEAKDLLARIAQTAKGEPTDAFRSTGQGKWPFFQEERLINAVKLSITSNNDPGSQLLQEITEPADYEPH